MEFSNRFKNYLAEVKKKAGKNKMGYWEATSLKFKRERKRYFPNGFHFQPDFEESFEKRIGKTPKAGDQFTINGFKGVLEVVAVLDVEPSPGVGKTIVTFL